MVIRATVFSSITAFATPFSCHSKKSSFHFYFSSLFNTSSHLQARFFLYLLQMGAFAHFLLQKNISAIFEYRNLLVQFASLALTFLSTAIQFFGIKVVKYDARLQIQHVYKDLQLPSYENLHKKIIQRYPIPKKTRGSVI